MPRKLLFLAQFLWFPKPSKPPATQKLELEALGVGVQIYECKPAKDEPKRFEWVFKAPEAELFDNTGKRIGRHYAGPTWESNDGSKVVGEVKGRDNGPRSGLHPMSCLTEREINLGNGVLVGPKASAFVYSGRQGPLEGCNQIQAGKEIRVAYKARYYFFTARP